MAEGKIWAALTAVIVAVLAAGVWTLIAASAPESDLPVIGSIPDFALTERSGNQVGLSALEGRVWVANFIFTSCSGICPVLSSRMKSVQKVVEEQDLDVRLISFSVDPTRDTPEVLRRYADRYGADPQRWLFLTGERDRMYALIGKGFLLSVAEREEGDAPGELITHSDRFVLVDEASQIRGYYHGTDGEDIRRLIDDLTALANR